MSPQKIKFIRELIMPYHKTVRKSGNPKVSTKEKRELLQKAQVGEGVLESVTKYLDVNYAPKNVVRVYNNGKTMEMRDLLNKGRKNFAEMYFKIISDKNLNSKYFYLLNPTLLFRLMRLSNT